jgi:hypothetical protein
MSCHLFCVVFLSFCFLSSFLKMQLFSNALCVQCILWGESARMVWGMNFFCGVWACEVRSFYMSSKFEVEGVRLKVEGLKFEVSTSSWMSKVGDVKSKVEGMRYEVFVSSWRFEVTIWSVKLFAKGWRYLYARSKVWSLRFHEVAGLSFEHSFCEVWSLRLEHFLWGLTFELSFWGLTIHCSLWSIKLSVRG